MIRSLLIFFFMAFAATAVAQEKVSVVLKNGKVLEGILLDALYEDFITIEYSALERENIHLSRVRGIYFGDYRADDPKTNIALPFFKREKGFFHISEVQLMLGQDENDTGFSNQTLYQTINGYAFRPWLMLGGGLGLDLYGEYLISPFFASIRGTVWQKKNSPFYYMNAGWAHFWKPEDNMVTYDEVKGGYHLQAGAGYQFSLRKSAVLLSFGYRLQNSRMQYSLDTWNWNGMINSNRVNEERLLRRFMLSLGFTF